MFVALDAWDAPVRIGSVSTSRHSQPAAALTCAGYPGDEGGVRHAKLELSSGSVLLTMNFNECITHILKLFSAIFQTLSWL